MYVRFHVSGGGCILCVIGVGRQRLIVHLQRGPNHGHLCFVQCCHLKKTHFCFGNNIVSLLEKLLRFITGTKCFVKLEDNSQ